MRSTTRLTAGALLAGLLLFGAVACGGGSKSSSSNGDSTATTAKSDSSSGGNSNTTVDVSNCSGFFKKFNDAEAKIQASMSGSSQMDAKAIMSTLDGLTSSVPSEIKDDWKTVLAATKKILDGMASVNLSDPASITPEQMAKLEALGSELDDPKVQKASDNLDAYAKKHCPQLVTN